jgi:Domain of unknown function (DUF4384)
MRILKILALGAVSLLAVQAMARDAQLRDLSVEQTTVAQAGVARPGSLQMSLTVDRPDATYAIGETVKMTLITNEEAYVTVFAVGASGQVVQLFPNRYQTDNHVQGGHPIEIGGGNSGAKVTVTGPVGAELIKVVASSKPVTVVSEAQLQNRHVFRTVGGGVQTLVRDLQITTDQAVQGDNKIALANYPLRTIASRVSAAPALIIVPGLTPPALAPAATTFLPVNFPQQPTAALLNIPSQQPFSLLMAIDRSSYRVGDKLTLSVTPLQACNLTVLDFATSGQVRTVFPNPTTPNNAIGALQTVLVAGGTSAVTFPVTGPAGTEQLMAICSTDQAPALTTPGDRAAVMRDLAVVAARSPGTTAMASVTFTVQP